MLKNKLFNIDNEVLQEVAFFVVAMIGATIVALSVSFIAVGLSVGTEPPAPYLVSEAQRQLMLALSVFGLGFGLVVMRLSAKFVGW